MAIVASRFTHFSGLAGFAIMSQTKSVTKYKSLVGASQGEPTRLSGKHGAKAIIK
jgi:hypothetical protein